MGKKKPVARRFTLRFSLFAVLGLIILVILLFILGLISWRFFTHSSTSQKVSHTEAASMLATVNQNLAMAKLSGGLMAAVLKSPIYGLQSLSHLINLSRYSVTLKPFVTQVYYADTEGNFLVSRRGTKANIVSEVVRHAPHPEHYYLHWDQSGTLLQRNPATTISFNSQQHPWYQLALSRGLPSWTAMDQSDRFLGPKTPGIRYTVPIKINSQHSAVVGIDITLAGIMAPKAENFPGAAGIVDRAGQIMASSSLKKDSVTSTPIQASWLKQAVEQYQQDPSRHEFKFVAAGNAYQASVFEVAAVFPQTWLFVMVMPYQNGAGPILTTQVLSLCIGIVLFGWLLTSLLARYITRPINTLAKELEKIKEFELNATPLPESRITEVAQMMASIHAVKAGLRVFQQYIPEALVRTLIKRGEAAEMGGRKRSITMLFTDIEQFTQVSDAITDEELMHQLCEYFDLLSTIVVSHKGTIDKYIGDSLMAFWGAPEDDPRQIVHACQCVLQAQVALAEQNKVWAASGKPVVKTRFGLNAGAAMVGNLGSSNRLSYTAVGHNVNVARRLEQINRVYGTYIIVSETVYTHAKQDFIFRIVDKVAVKGQRDTPSIYQLIAENTPENRRQYANLCDMSQRGLSAYQQQQWLQAEGWYQQLLSAYPQDSVATVFIARCRYQLQGSPSSLDAVDSKQVMTEKSK
jgi:adenylate cyclase